MATKTRSQLLLAKYKKELIDDPVEGFAIDVQDNNLFSWKIYLEGPKDTPYAGGVFQLLMTFPQDFPDNPPELKFLSEFWHPNVYPDGKVCISILHPPGDDPLSDEKAADRWLPTRSISSIVLSVSAMLCAPNIYSLANVDASKEMQHNKEAFNKRLGELIQKANAKVPSHIHIPHPDSNPSERKKKVEEQTIDWGGEYDLSLIHI
eukprot:TRINITY_DN4164_c0_g1_i5.p1 TRINITY_DN4164_c0_g1~~TRINITY_DN4164_c0_g1_i5.p1  ORF type:complete len:206 (+),score=40.23 TRINITY_DN4164_c0_g1_i5:207-824(+)